MGEGVAERMRTREAILALAVVLVAAAARASEPVAPKLDPPPTAPAVPADDAPARAIAPTVAVCRDRAAKRCWTAPRGADCGGVDAVYRVVIAAPGRTDADDALAACRQEMTEGAR
jgi:hypothetical protein